MLIDCDPGNGVPGANVDDGLALAFAVAASPAIRLEAVTIVAGNTPAEVGFDVARSMMSDFGADVPVYLGAERALVEEPARWRRHFDREDDRGTVERLWSNTPRPRSFSHSKARKAAHAIGELVTGSPGEITIVAIGPLTNIALALRLYPSLKDDVAEIVIMGGAFDADEYPVDTNFGFDPEAARIVLTSGARITLVPMDVTTHTLLSHTDLDRIEQFGNPISASLVPSMRPWLTYSKATRGIEGCWIHDALAVALLVDRSVATSRRYVVDVELAPGLSRGRSIRWTPGRLQSSGDAVPERPPIDVLVSVDNAGLVQLLLAVITSFHS